MNNMSENCTALCIFKKQGIICTLKMLQKKKRILHVGNVLCKIDRIPKQLYSDSF